MRPPREITEPVSLCIEEGGARGQLNPAARGWARHPLIRGEIPGSFLRRKRWNFVFVSNPDVLVAAALSHADYVGLGFIWLYDLKRKLFLELEHLSPLGRGVHIGPAIDDEASFVSGPLTYHWRPGPTAGNNQASREIQVLVTAPQMKGSAEPLELRLRISLDPADESFNLVVPWSESRFNYTGKIVALPCEGELRAGGHTYSLRGNETLASLDCTRGIWPYSTSWRWASGAGLIGGRRIGVNFGAGWTETAGVLENALYADGKVLPLWEPVEFTFDAAALERPWQLRTADGQRVALTFTPTYERTQDTNLGLIRIRLQQVMGTFSGQLVIGSGEVVKIEGLPGIAENHQARW